MLQGCPNCRGPLGWTWVWFPIWTRWKCRHCGAVLGINPASRFLLVGVMVVAWAVALFVLRPAGRDESLLAAGLLLGLTVFLVYVFDRPRLIEATGFRCRDCGYDLRGQTESRCPECGKVFDEEERARILAAAGVHAKRSTPRKWTLIFFLAVVLLLAAQILGIVVLRYTRMQPAATAASSQPTSQLSTPAGEAVSQNDR